MDQEIYSHSPEVQETPSGSAATDAAVVKKDQFVGVFDDPGRLLLIWVL
jgi:hypothetical protein